MARAYAKRPVEQIALIRRSVQVAFLVLNVWIGVLFYLWVRYFETGGTSVYSSARSASHQPTNRKTRLDGLLGRESRPEAAHGRPQSRGFRSGRGTPSKNGQNMKATSNRYSQGFAAPLTGCLPCLWYSKTTRPGSKNR